MGFSHAITPNSNVIVDWVSLLARAPNADPLHNKTSKRILDVAGAVVLIILTAPLMLLIALAIRADGGPAIFRHQRVGARGKSFLCLKFRTMHVRAREMLQQHLATHPQDRAEWEALFKLKNDPRVTRLGRFLRKSSLDELPQLFNVLAGEMSLVGPRPIIPEEIARYGGEFGFYAYCRPGLTGLWQISGRTDVDYARRVAFDHQYVAGWTLWRDIWIILATPKVMLAKSGAY
ncbi:MAG TPA: sugar transferase [Patescibacteria group bacterium]|nr:sugar transferase [Patescibacteria group bacterium]